METESRLLVDKANNDKHVYSVASDNDARDVCARVTRHTDSEHYE